MTTPLFKALSDYLNTVQKELGPRLYLNGSLNDFAGDLHPCNIPNLAFEKMGEHWAESHLKPDPASRQTFFLESLNQTLQAVRSEAESNPKTLILSKKSNAQDASSEAVSRLMEACGTHFGTGLFQRLMRQNQRDLPYSPSLFYYTNYRSGEGSLAEESEEIREKIKPLASSLLESMPEDPNFRAGLLVGFAINAGLGYSDDLDISLSASHYCSHMGHDLLFASHLIVALVAEGYPLSALAQSRIFSKDRLDGAAENHHIVHKVEPYFTEDLHHLNALAEAQALKAALPQIDASGVSAPKARVAL